MNKEQQKEHDRWKYLVKGIGWKHQQAWKADILRNEGLEAAELFERRCRYINK